MPRPSPSCRVCGGPLAHNGVCTRCGRANPASVTAPTRPVRLTPVGAGAPQLSHAASSLGLPARPSPVSPKTARSAGAGTRGLVDAQVHRSEIDEPFQPWRAATLMVLTAWGCSLVLPLAVATVVATTVFQLAGFRLPSLGVGRWISLLVWPRMRPQPRKVAVTHFLLRGPQGVQEVRLVGSLRSGTIHPGHDLEVWGRQRDGTLWLERARDHTAGTELHRPHDWWRTGFFLLMVPPAVLLLLSLLQGVAA